MPLSNHDRTVLAEAKRRGLIGRTPGAFMAGLFPLQRAVIEDPSKRKTLRCGRRAGKTKTFASKQVNAVEKHPGGISLYVALSRPTAERLMWGELKRLDREHTLGLSFNDQKLEARHPNGGQIWLAGADDKKEREKLRGHAFVNVDLDEAGSFGPYLNYLIEEVLEPAMQDYDGEICLGGSPPAACAGIFHDADTGIAKGWTRHHWTVLDNEMFPRWRGQADWQARAQAWVRELKASKGWVDDHPVFLREWLGRWVRDDSSLVYHYQAGRNTYENMPKGAEWEYVLGVDLGYDDATAFVVGAFSRDAPDFYAVETHKESGMVVSEVADKVRAYAQRYRLVATVADTGGLGKMVVEELRKRHSLAIRPAEKASKFEFIEHMNSDMMAGRVLAKYGSELCGEWEILQYDEDRKKEDPRFENHLADACLYAWRESRHYQHKTKQALPEKGSAEYYALQAAEQRQRAIGRVSRRDRDMLGEIFK